MRGRIIKAIVFCFVLLLLVSCAAQVISDGASKEGLNEGAKPLDAESLSMVITGGEVPVEYLEPDAYSADRLAEGKAMFEEKCGICHTDSGRDLVYFGDPDFNSARVIGSVKKFVGAATDPEIGEKVFEYLRYNNDGPFVSQDEPFLQPGPLELEPGIVNPILNDDEDFWAALTGHSVPTAKDVDISGAWDTYDMKRVILPYEIASWSEFMPHEVPYERAMRDINNMMRLQKYDMTKLPLTDKGMGAYFNFATNSIYTKHQFASHDYWKFDRSMDFIEAVYSTSLLCKLGVLDFEYGLPQRVNGEWNGKWEWGPYENTILWGPGSNLDNLFSYGINPFEAIFSREAYRNKWTQYSTMFVTGEFQPSSFYWYASMPWGCKTYDSGLFGGANTQLFTGMMGFAEMWKHSQTYTDKTYTGTEMVADYGAATRKYLLDMYWMYEGLPYYSGNKEGVASAFLEMIYRQWTASIGVTDNQLRTLISDSYNLPDGDRDSQRYSTVLGAFLNLREAMTKNEQDLVKAYLKRIYPTNPSTYKSPFTANDYDIIAAASNKPVVVPFGPDTAVVNEEYELRILRAQAVDGDVEITAADLPDGAELVKKKGNWKSPDYDYSIKWTPAKNQAGKTFTIQLTGKGNGGTTTVSYDIKVLKVDEDLAIEPIADYSVYAGQELTFPITVNRYDIEGMDFWCEGDFGKVINNYGSTAGIFTVNTTKADVGAHDVKVCVMDKHGDTAAKVVHINVIDNSAPVVTVTPNGSGPGGNKNIYRIKAGETFTLTFNVTDADGDAVEISKNPEFPGFIYGNTYSYTVEDSMAEYFPGPNVLTFYIKDIKANSNPFAMPEYKGGVAKKVFLVYFEPADADPNHTPWAIAGNPQKVNSGETVTLDASGSDDTDGDPITYKWEQITGPQVELSDAAAVNPSFTAPVVEKTTILKFYLTVTDPYGLEDKSVVRIQVDPATKL